MNNGYTEYIRESIMRDMSEGVMVIGLDGIINYVNPAAAEILGYTVQALMGQKFIRCFFGIEENDAFNQTILDAVYDASVSHRNVVPYYTQQEIKQLHVTTSYLKKEQVKIGVIVVLSDISELTELRDAVKAMNRIKELNGQLEIRNKLLNETFGRFLSDEIVRQLLETPDGLMLGGKKRTLTIMMSDLRGFTALSERMPAQDLIAMLNHYLGSMTEVIQRRNGTIIEFIGDGIMAVFGAPLPSDQHAADAAAAAVEMQIKMEEINAWNGEKGYPMLEMGIGLNSGEVIVGNIGSEKRTKYGVVGSHVNLCGRIESYTVGGQILLSPTTRALIKEPLEIAQEQSVFPKGVKEPLQLTQITGIGGEYGLSHRQRFEKPKPLQYKQEVAFFVIRDKHSDLESNIGYLTAVSESGAIMETAAEIKQFENLQLNTCGKLFCKVMKQTDTGWLLQFTAKPPEFLRWYQSIS